MGWGGPSENLVKLSGNTVHLSVFVFGRAGALLHPTYQRGSKNQKRWEISNAVSALIV